jgi:hypothetical protein
MGPSVRDDKRFSTPREIILRVLLPARHRRGIKGLKSREVA